MKNYIILLTVFLCFSTVCIFGQTVANDAQIRAETTFEFPLDKKNKKLSGVISNETRLTNKITDLTDFRFGFGVKYQAGKNLVIQPGYIFRIDRLAGRPNRYEHRFLFDLTLQKDFKKIVLDNRSRFEHRIKTANRKDDTFYRDRIRLQIPIRKDGKTLVTPFVSEEIYLDLQNAKVFRNDLDGGIKRKFTNNFAADLYYRYRRDFRPGIKQENLFAIRLYLQFKKK